MPLPKKLIFHILKKLLPILILVILQVQVYGNNRQVDSLLRSYRNSSHPHQKFIALEKLAKQYVSYLPDSSLYYGYKGLVLAQKNQNVGQRVEAHILISEAFFSKRMLDSCRKHYKLAINTATENKSFAGECTAYRRMAEYYEQLGKRDSALYCLIKSYELSGKSGDKIEKASCLNSIGTFYKRQGNFEKALEYSMQSLTLWQEIDNLKSGGILSDIGNIYFQQSKPAEALKYYKSAYKVIKDNNDPLGLGFTLGNIGLVYLVQKNYDDALNYFLKSVHNYELAMNKEGIANINAHISRVYFEKGNYPLSLQYGELALVVSREINNKYLISKCYSILADAYQKSGNYKNAYDALKLFTLYTDSVQDAAMQQKVADMQANYEIASKDAENKALRADAERNEVLIQKQKHRALFITIVLAMVIVISVLMFRTSRQRKLSLAKLRDQNKTIEGKSLELATLNVKIMAQKAQLEEASQFKDKILSIVSHDFRSPLNSLQGFLMILSEDDLPKETVKMLSHSLLEKVKTTTGFLDNLLSWAQSQLQGYKPTAKNVNLQKAAEDIILLFKAQADAKGVKVINNINDCCEVNADLNMVKLVIRNLVSNAIKYTSSGGSVTISCTENENEEIISVADTGKGISLEDQQKMFQQQGFTTLGTSNEKGTGLGLMLCKEFVERNGGNIWVDSEVGKGSTFSFSIPAVKSSQQNPVDINGVSA